MSISSKTCTIVSSRHTLAQRCRPTRLTPFRGNLPATMICLLQRQCNPKTSLHNVPFWATCNTILKADMCNTKYTITSPQQSAIQAGALDAAENCQSGQIRSIPSQAAHIQEAKMTRCRQISSMMRFLGALAIKAAGAPSLLHPIQGGKKNSKVCFQL